MSVLILDIDGVINPFDARHNATLSGFTEYQYHQYSVFLHESTKQWLQKISEVSTIVWGSAWGSESNRILDMLGINQSWLHIPLQTEDVGLGTWKIKSIRKWVEQDAMDEVIVWVDDELEDDAHKWATERGNMLTIAPDRYRGLTGEQFQQIYEFLVR